MSDVYLNSVVIVLGAIATILEIRSVRKPALAKAPARI